MSASVIAVETSTKKSNLIAGTAACLACKWSSPAVDSMLELEYLEATEKRTLKLRSCLRHSIIGETNMTMRVIKRAARKIGKRLGFLNTEFQPTEMAEDYYDSAFSRDPQYHVPFYKSPYYPTWTLVVDRLRRYGCKKILDVGCGPGQFAEVVADSGFDSYLGLDFSTVAIKMAQAKNPQLRFQVADVTKPSTYESLDFDSIVCMEVLEHIDNDLAVVSCYPAGIRCLVTVPNFPWKSHVRHFETAESVSLRYSDYFDDCSVTRIKGTRSKDEQFFLLDGVRNQVVQPEST